MFENQKVTFIGIGNMAEAIVRGMIAQEVVTADQILGSDLSAARRAHMVDSYGIGVTDDSAAAVADADVVVLAVKPQIFPKVVPVIAGQIREGAMVVSVMAGTTIETMTTALQHQAVVRSMPNTPAMIGKGVIGWTATDVVSDMQKQQAQAIFSALGTEAYFDDEKFLDMTTALTGSGPAYVFLFMEAMMDAAVKMGFGRAAAEQMVAQLVAGSAEYYQQSGTHITELRNQVTSPGGTTAAGLHRMETHNLRTAVAEGIFASYAQSVALGKK